MQSHILHKVVAIIFAIYLPFISVGIPLHKHYCEGELHKSQLLFQPDSCHASIHDYEANSCCGFSNINHSNDENTSISCHSDFSSCSAHNEDDCCKDEVELIKIDFSLLKTSSNNNIDVLSIFTPIYFLVQTNKIDIPNKNILFPEPVYYLPDGQARQKVFQQFLC